MRQTFSRREKLKQLFHILIPILITQLSMYAMNFFDTMMSGHYSSSDLAGVAIGSSLWVPVFTGLSGILLSITPIIAQLVGAKKHDEVAFAVVQGVYLAVFISIAVLLAGTVVIQPILGQMDLDPNVRAVAYDFLVGLSTGIVPLFVYNVLRSFMDALGKTRVSMIITLLSLPINVLFNYLLIYGKFGMPELGGAGSGYASAITYWLIALIAAFIIQSQRPFSNYGVFKRLYRISIAKWKEIMKIGVPIGFSIFFETSIFAAVTLFMSGYNTVTIASHQAAMNFSSFLYMVPLSISMALTIVVGFEVGARRYRDAREYSWLGVSFAVFMSGICGVILFMLRTEIASIYSNETQVIELTAQFLLYAFFFQLSDAVQAPIQGALRGYKDVNITFIMSLVSYWVIGLPLGYYLANFTGLNAFGYWIGLIAGLAAGAICLSTRLVYIQKKKFRPGHAST
ncbi:MATE family efflux transporter [Bacillus sp. T33-2]|uniref:MATE family efflux transporter n=1 Tax=Bacillus sp. T33-2 TaxID=2054168 RepID=UPI000C780680|nr:MATE family efflux transporter [Bacillus sp. T33-2]PLR98853.1 MATE family efflux transporter [Bacillus sp. T33-2]